MGLMNPRLPLGPDLSPYRTSSFQYPLLPLALIRPGTHQMAEIRFSERGVAFHLHPRNMQVFRGRTTISFQFPCHSRVLVPRLNPVPVRLFRIPLPWPSRSPHPLLISVNERCFRCPKDVSPKA